LANGLVQMLYGLQQLLDQQQEIPEIRPAPKLDMGGFYLEAGIAVVFLGLVYLICLLYVLGHVNSSLRSIWPGT
jgi:hypothetical protein